MINKLKNITNTEDKKRLLSNFFSLSILQAFTYILPLLTLPYLVRVLGVDKFGLVMFAQSFIIFFNILVDYGFNLSSTREVSIHRDNKEKLTEIFSSVMSIKVMLIFVSFFILTIVVFSFEKFSNDWELYYLSFLVVIGNAMFPIWYFQGIEKMKYITIVNITSKLIFTILIFIVIQEPSDYIYVPILNGFGFIIGGILSLWIVFYKFNQKFCFKNMKIKEHIRNGFHVFLSISSSTILSATPILLIGTFLDYTMAGYYSAFEKLVSAIKSFFYIINQTFFPRLSKIFSESKEKYLILWKRLSIYTIISSVVLYIFLYFTSSFFLSYYLGANFIEHIYIFEILSVTIVLYTIINALGLNGLLVIGKHKQLSMSQIIPAIIFILISPIVLLKLGFITFLFLIIIADFVIIFIRIYFFKRIFNGKS
jgi:PST family polysaccharide transporter